MSKLVYFTLEMTAQEIVERLQEQNAVVLAESRKLSAMFQEADMVMTKQQIKAQKV